MEIRIIKTKKQAKEEIGFNNIKNCKDCFKFYKQIGKETIFTKEEENQNHLFDLDSLNNEFNFLVKFYNQQIKGGIK